MECFPWKNDNFLSLSLFVVVVKVIRAMFVLHAVQKSELRRAELTEQCGCSLPTPCPPPRLKEKTGHIWARWKLFWALCPNFPTFSSTWALCVTSLSVTFAVALTNVRSHAFKNFLLHLILSPRKAESLSFLFTTVLPVTERVCGSRKC